MGLTHDHGVLTIEGPELVNREHGKNPPTRKEWDKEDRIPAAEVAWVLVQSRDRVAFAFDVIDAAQRSRLRVTGVRSKPDLDALLRELSQASPASPIALAHPAFGLADPATEAGKAAAKKALEFNTAEQKRREQALGVRPELKVKTYDSHKDFETTPRRWPRTAGCRSSR